MIKIISALAAIALAAAGVAPLVAAPTVPQHIQIATVTAGPNEGGVVTLTGPSGDTARVVVSLCDVRASQNAAFYILASGTTYIIVRQDAMDYAWERSGNNWDVTLQALLAASLVCVVEPLPVS